MLNSKHPQFYWEMVVLFTVYQHSWKARARPPPSSVEVQVTNKRGAPEEDRAFRLDCRAGMV